jgi:hypothetical protein
MQGDHTLVVILLDCPGWHHNLFWFAYIDDPLTISWTLLTTATVASAIAGAAHCDKLLRNGLMRYTCNSVGGGSYFGFGMSPSLPLEPELAPCGWRCPHRRLTLMRPFVNWDMVLVSETVSASADRTNAGHVV